jgi:hypothetical protein
MRGPWSKPCAKPSPRDHLNATALVVGGPLSGYVLSASPRTAAWTPDQSRRQPIPLDGLGARVTRDHQHVEFAGQAAEDDRTVAWHLSALSLRHAGCMPHRVCVAQ